MLHRALTVKIDKKLQVLKANANIYIYIYIYFIYATYNTSILLLAPTPYNSTIANKLGGGAY